MSRIAYITSSGQLAMAAPDGSDSRVLTMAGTVFQFPAWSPDGLRLAAVGGDARGGGVFVVPDVSGTSPLHTCYLSRAEPPIYLAWSPSGQLLSFITFTADGLRLLLVGYDGGAPRTLTQGQPCFWDWTPDGGSLLVHTGSRVGEPDLAFYAADGSGRGPRLADPGLFQAPSVARSGHCWAFAEVGEGGETWLVIERADGLARVSLPHEGAVALGWCPTRDQLAFICPAVPAQQFYGPLRLVNLGTEFVRTLVDAMVLAFFWSPDGRRIAYLTLAGEADRRPLPVVGSTNSTYTNGRTPPLRVQRRTSPERGLDLWVVEVVGGTQRHLASFVPPSPFINQFLPFFDQYAHSHSLWAPDSSALVVPVTSADRPEIMVVPADGSPLYPVAEGIMASWGG